MLEIDIPKSNTTFLVLNTILPLYAGSSITDENADIIFSTKTDSSYKIKFEWNELVDSKPQSLYVLPETTAILAIGSRPNHLLSIKIEDNTYKINGHSVMTGYVDDNINSQVFKDDSLIISK